MRHVILHNLWLKLISVGLGAVLWFSLHSQVQSDAAPNQIRVPGQLGRQRFKIPIHVISQPGDSRAFKLSTRDAILEVVGEEAVLRKLLPRDLKVYVDVTDFNSRQPVSEVLRPYVPPDVIVSDIQPATITVEPVAPATNVK